MTQYQSFPDNPGASLTLDKLKILRLPDLSGKQFLDVGCNEGFFCGYAQFQGASRSVGLDQSPLFIGRARERFPRCEFHQQSWDRLPDGPFDVILLASALHYAEDQPALIRNLIERLSPDGVLVLELGVVSSRDAEWRQVDRGIDKRWFPSMPMLREVLADYAWKWMGPSIHQDGDPVPRHVVHVGRKRPVAYLLMQPPGYGKSSLCKDLFEPAGIPVISGDQRMADVARGKGNVPDALGDLIRRDYSPYDLDQLLERIFEERHAEAMVDLWLQGAPGGNLALDAFVPAAHHAVVEACWRERGYLPVTLQWDRIGPAPLGEEETEARANAFYLAMADGDGSDAGMEILPQGFVDEVWFEQDELTVRGWAVDSLGCLPQQLRACLKRQTLETVRLERQLRVDVQRHLGLPQALVGYRLVCRLPAGIGRRQIVDGLSVDDGQGGTRYNAAGNLDDILKSA